jgi:hypothetical protein
MISSMGTPVCTPVVNVVNQSISAPVVFTDLREGELRYLCPQVRQIGLRHSN